MHKIEKYDRPTIFNSFKSVVYAPNEDTYKEMKEELLNNETVLKYENLLKHVQEEILPRKEEWSLTTRFENNYSTHSVNTTNYAEVSFRITKENQFNRVKRITWLIYSTSFSMILSITCDVALISETIVRQSCTIKNLGICRRNVTLMLTKS